MTGLAFDAEADVPLVVEQHMLGQKIGFDPGRRGLGVVIPVLFLDPPVVGNDIVVAVKTFFHRWQARVIRMANIGMTILALDRFVAGMQAMTERDGLFRPDHALGRRIKKEEERRHQDDRHRRPEKRGGVGHQPLPFFLQEGDRVHHATSLRPTRTNSGNCFR